MGDEWEQVLVGLRRGFEFCFVSVPMCLAIGVRPAGLGPSRWSRWSRSVQRSLCFARFFSFSSAVSHVLSPSFALASAPFSLSVFWQVTIRRVTEHRHSALRESLVVIAPLLFAFLKT